MPQDAHTAENIARLRLDRRLTQAALAERVGLSRVALGRIERGSARPRTRPLGALAQALEVPVRDLFTRVRPLRNVRFRAHSKMYDGEMIVVCETVEDFLEAVEQDLSIIAPDELAAAFGFSDLPEDLDLMDEPLPRAVRNNDCLPSDD